ncbi:hypothetical protein [Phormidesmis sp. 146-33]
MRVCQTYRDRFRSPPRLFHFYQGFVLQPDQAAVKSAVTRHT